VSRTLHEARLQIEVKKKIAEENEDAEAYKYFEGNLAGFDAAVTALSGMGGEFDEEAYKKAYQVFCAGDVDLAFKACGAHFAKWQHAQLAPIIGALKADIESAKSAIDKVCADRNNKSKELFHANRDLVKLKEEVRLLREEIGMNWLEGTWGECSPYEHVKHYAQMMKKANDKLQTKLQTKLTAQESLLRQKDDEIAKLKAKYET
jgi:hypothetical protein